MLICFHTKTSCTIPIELEAQTKTVKFKLLTYALVVCFVFYFYHQWSVVSPLCVSIINENLIKGHLFYLF